MLFNSFAFAVFLPIVFLLYWLFPAKYRYLFLLAVSFYFYMSLDIRYMFFLLFTAVLSYLLARTMECAPHAAAKKAYLISGVFLLIGVLFLLKYLNFFFRIVISILQTAGLPAQSPTLHLMLPIGISFYTFQTLGYLIDIYRGKYPAERHLGYYLLFVSFFPQITSGPIAKGDILLPQLKQTAAFDSSKAAYGLKLMAVGYFKKLVVAGLTAPTVNAVFNNPMNYIGLAYFIAVFLFALQIYCDFSGYTDIAVGCAKLFGIDLCGNFKSPYFSHSIKEFWSRWHISLSSWFRDYLYIPLGGNRVGKFRHCLNLLLTFLASGLWHGASVTYLIWGGIHGVCLIIETLLLKSSAHQRKERGFLSVFMTFLIVCAAWVFFRAHTVEDACRILSLGFFGIGNPYDYLKTAVISLDIDFGHMIYISIPVILLALYDYVSLKTDVIACISSKKAWFRYPVYVGFLLFILLFSAKGVSTDFYYSQF